MNFSKDVKSDKQLELYNVVIMVSGFLTVLIIFPIINILIKGLNAEISIIFLVIISILIVISAIYLFFMTDTLFSTGYPTILNATTALLSIGIEAILVGLMYFLHNSMSVDKSLGKPLLVIKFGICCIAVAQCLIGYFLYPLYETPATSTSE